MRLLAAVTLLVLGSPQGTLHFERHDVETWSSSLLEESDSATSTWSGVIPAGDVNGTNVFYYIHAIDSEGNESFFPPDGEANPASFRVNPDG